MRIRWTTWKAQFIEKLQVKHGVSMEEVDEVLTSSAHFLKAEEGRYLVVFFIFKRPDSALPISARDMSRTEKKYYEKKRQKG